MKTWVITCNDSVEHVVIGGTQQDAEEKLVELAQAYYDRNPTYWDLDAKNDWRGTKTGYQVMRERCHWTVRDIENSIAGSVLESIAEEISDG